MRSKLSKKTTNAYSLRGKRTSRKQAKESAQAVWYDIPYPASDYVFPQEALIKAVRFDNDYIQIGLIDGRILSIPLEWIPTLYHAAPAEREKFEISEDQTMIIWDPDKCAINDEIRITDYLGPCHKEP